MSSEQSGEATVCVFGGGSFGTALAYVVSHSPLIKTIWIYTRNEKVIESINNQHINSEYVKGCKLPHKIMATGDIDLALRDAICIVYAIPVQTSQEYLGALKGKIPPTLPIVSSSKGICTKTLKLMTDIIPDALDNPKQPCAFLSGPSFAKELLSDEPTGMVLAASDPKLTQTLLPYFSSKKLRVYTSDDVLGVELGGALKNVFAIAAGICTGLGYGMNSKSMLITRGISEMTRIATKMGAKPETLSGLAGIGDLMLTCYGSLSRNQQVGIRLGKGETIQQILADYEEVAEGVATTPAALQLAHTLNIKVPLISAVAAVLEGKLSPIDAVQKLMSLPTGPEVEYTSTTQFFESTDEVV